MIWHAGKIGGEKGDFFSLGDIAVPIVMIWRRFRFCSRLKRMGLRVLSLSMNPMRYPLLEGWMMTLLARRSPCTSPCECKPDC